MSLPSLFLSLIHSCYSISFLIKLLNCSVHVGNSVIGLVGIYHMHTGAYKNIHSPSWTFCTIYSSIHHYLLLYCTELKARGVEYFFIVSINPLIKLCCVKLQDVYQGVPAYGGFVSKRSSTHAAHVGLLSRVDSLMSLQGIELSELLIAVLTMIRSFTCGKKCCVNW